MTVEQIMAREAAIQVGYWKAAGVEPWEAWEAMDGCPLRLVVTWSNVQNLAEIRIYDMRRFSNDRTAA